MQNRLWAGRIMSGLAVLFLLFDGVIHMMTIAPVVGGGLYLRDDRLRALIPLRA